MLTVEESIKYYEDILEHSERLSMLWLDSYMKLSYYKGVRDERRGLVVER